MDRGKRGQILSRLDIGPVKPCIMRLISCHWEGITDIIKTRWHQTLPEVQLAPDSVAIMFYIFGVDTWQMIKKKSCNFSRNLMQNDNPHPLPHRNRNKESASKVYMLPSNFRSLNFERRGIISYWNGQLLRLPHPITSRGNDDVASLIRNAKKINK